MIPSVKKGGTAVVSMQDIADKAGVSRVTVSRVLSNHPSVKAETRQKVLYWVKELDYEPNLIAQSLAGNRTNTIGLLVPEIAYPFFSEIIESIESQAFYEGYSVIICNTHRSLYKEKNILAQLRQRFAASLRLYGSWEYPDFPAYKLPICPHTVLVICRQFLLAQAPHIADLLLEHLHKVSPVM